MERLFNHLVFSTSSPLVAVLSNPVQKRALKTHIVTGFFRFQPFVFQDLVAFGQKFLIKA